MLKPFAIAAFAVAALCPASGALADPAAPAAVVETSKGAALADPRGFSLYTFDNDEEGKSACTGSCAVTWPPLIAAPGSSGSGPWTLIARDDDSAQWAYKGQPLYTFVKDEKPGDANGDELNNVWRLARP